MVSPNDGLPGWKIRRLKRRCAKTWRWVLDKYNPWIVGLIHRTTRGQDDTVEDLLQDLWCEAIRSIDGYEVGTPFVPWLMERVPKGRPGRSIRSFRTSPSLDEWPDGRLDGAELEAGVDIAAFISAALEHLSARDRDLITRRHLDGLSIDWVAEEFGLTYEAAKKAIQRAQERLGQLLEPYRLQLLPHRPQRCLLPIEPTRDLE